MEFTGGDFSLRLLASVDEALRLDALRVFTVLTVVQLPPKFFNELLVRITVLLEEGLKEDSKSVTKEQTLLCLEVLTNWMRLKPQDAEKKTETLHSFGLIALIITHLESSSVQV